MTESLCPQKPGPLAPIPAPPFPPVVSGQGGIRAPACRPTDGEAGQVNQCLLPPWRRAPRSSWPPGVFLERQDAAWTRPLPGPPPAPILGHLLWGDHRLQGLERVGLALFQQPRAVASQEAQSGSPVPSTAGSPVSEPLQGDTHPLLMSPSQTQPRETGVGTIAKQAKQRCSRAELPPIWAPRAPRTPGGTLNYLFPLEPMASPPSQAPGLIKEKAQPKLYVHFYEATAII